MTSHQSPRASVSDLFTLHASLIQVHIAEDQLLNLRAINLVATGVVLSAGYAATLTVGGTTDEIKELVQWTRVSIASLGFVLTFFFALTIYAARQSIYFWRKELEKLEEHLLEGSPWGIWRKRKEWLSENRRRRYVPKLLGPNRIYLYVIPTIFILASIAGLSGACQA